MWGFYYHWVIIASLLLLQSESISQQPQHMTREEAAQIAKVILQVGQFPGTLYWTTTQELPAQQEVPWYDTTLLNRLAEQGKASITIEFMNVSWFHPSSPYEEAYVFPLTFNPIPDRAVGVFVNRWTGFLQFNLPRKDLTETNTALGLGNYPVLTLEQKRLRALEIAQKVLGAGTFVVRDEFSPPPSEGDVAEWGTCFLIYKIDPQTNARLLKSAILWINSRTGWLEAATIINRPTTISTIPKNTEQQARNIAINYLSTMGITVTQWVNEYVGGKPFHGSLLPGYVDTGLFVIEDGLLQQHLIWQLVYIGTYGNNQERASSIIIDAHTGEVLNNFSLALVSRCLRKSLHQAPLKIYSFLINDKETIIVAPLLLQNGRIYIWEEYTDNLGVNWDRKRLTGANTSLCFSVGEWLIYKGRRYLPLRRLCEVAGIYLEWDNRRKQLHLRLKEKPQERIREIRSKIENLRATPPLIGLVAPGVNPSLEEMKKWCIDITKSELQNLPLSEKQREQFIRKLVAIRLDLHYGRISLREAERRWRQVCNELEEALIGKSDLKSTSFLLKWSIMVLLLLLSIYFAFWYYRHNISLL